MTTLLLPYDHATFHSLTDSNAMRGLADEHLDDLQALGELICEHDLEKTVGVTLAHRHHDLFGCERLVWKLIDMEWFASPAMMADTELVPLQWKVDVSAGSSPTWRPLEFCPRTDQYKPEIQAAALITASESFLEEFLTLVVELRVEEIFGMGLLQCREYFCQPGKVVFEESDLGNRMTKVRLVDNIYAENNTGGVTLWNFTSTGLHANKGCAQGNSRHCCGEHHKLAE